VKSRLLIRLEADIRGAADPLFADCLRCERAAYLARLGDSQGAASELADVQRRHAARPDARVSAWVNFAEAVVGHYENHAPHAHDKMKRAHALSAAVGHQPLQALSAAWLGHFCYRASQPTAMARHAAQALTLAEPEHHAARARACLVVAQSYHDGGRFEVAKPWYDKANRHATAEGDDTMTSAIMSNQSSLRLVALQQAEARNRSHPNDDAFARAGIESTAEFDQLRGLTGMHELASMMQAQVFTALGRTAEALHLYESHLDAALQQCPGMEGSWRADLAWCRFRDGQQQAARADADRADVCLQRPGSWSDRAAGHGRLAQVYEGLEAQATAQQHAEAALRAWDAYRAEQGQLIEALDREFGTQAA
jgi:hypothetical protein